jgi:hypothetical protein
MEKFKLKKKVSNSINKFFWSLRCGSINDLINNLIHHSIKRSVRHSTNDSIRSASIRQNVISLVDNDFVNKSKENKQI